MTGPSSLIEEQVVILKNTVGKSLASRIVHIEFDREKARNYQELKKIRKMMEKAPEEGFIFLMSINSAQILSNLALKEHLIKNGLNGSHSSDLAKVEQELFKIRKLWKEEVCNFVDESRTVLGSDKHVFALGSKIPLSEGHLLRTICFYSEILFDQEIALRWRFNFLKNSGTLEDHHERIEITPESFPLLKEELIQVIIKKKGLGQSERAYFQGLTNDFDSDPDLRYYKNQLNVYLPYCLTAKQGSRYDIFPDNGSHLAVPCMAGVPRPSYEFATRDELINFTFQANLAHEISKKLVCEFVNTIDACAIKGESCSTHQLLFNTILQNLEIKKMESHHDVNLICNYLNDPKNLVHKTYFLGLTVVSQISTFSHKVESSSHSFIFSHTTLHGASATVNGDLMPPEIKTIEDPTAGIENLCALIKQKSQVITTSETEPLSILRACLNHDIQVLIDLAGFFSELSEEVIISTLFNLHPKCLAVHYYNVKGEPMLWKRDQKVPQLRKKTDKLEQNFFTYIRESKSEGTDTPMQTGAKALVTVDWRTTQTSADQAIGRMRGLKKGESIHFFTTEKNILLINERLKQEGIPFKDSLEALLRYFSIQDGIKNSREYFAGLVSYYFALVEDLAWDLVSKGDSNKGKIFSLFEPILSLLAEPENPIITAQTTMSAALAVHHIKNTFRNSLQAIVKEHQLTINLDQIEARFDLFAKDCEKKLTKAIKSGDLTGTSEQMTIVDVVLEAEHSTQVQKHKVQGSFFRPINPLNSIQENEKGIFLGIPVFFTNNYSTVSEDLLDNLKNRKPGYFSTIKINGNSIQLCALSIYDALAINRQLSQQSCQMVNIERGGQEGIFLLVKDKVIATNYSALETPTLDEMIKNIPIPDLNKKIQLLCKLLGRQEKFSIEEFSFLSSEQTVEAQTWAACSLNLNINVF